LNWISLLLYAICIFPLNEDWFNPGISVSNSEVALASLSIACFRLRLVCNDGMISKTEVSPSYRHISLENLGEFPMVPEGVSFELGSKRTSSGFRSRPR
jgi:hypothetical protein